MYDRVGYEVERMEYPLGEGRVMYLAKKIYERIMKKADVVGMRVNDTGWDSPKLLIEYRTKKGNGVYELYDIGPRPEKPKKEVKLKKEQKSKNN